MKAIVNNFLLNNTDLVGVKDLIKGGYTRLYNHPYNMVGDFNNIKVRRIRTGEIILFAHCNIGDNAIHGINSEGNKMSVSCDLVELI